MNLSCRIWLASALAISLLTGCGGGHDTGSQRAEVKAAEEGRLSARPGRGGGNCAPGEHQVALGNGRAALVRVTAGGQAGKKALLLVLHGAGGGSRDGLYAFRGGWDAAGLVMVAPAAQGATWSVVRGADTDLPYVDRALARAFARCRIDPRRVAVGGFSDGATYALTLGLANGDLFRALVGLSPGGLLTEKAVGMPRVFIAHGTLDKVLSMSRTSDVIVRELRGAGYSVTYRRFRGGHKVLPSISRASVRWFLRG